MRFIDKFRKRVRLVSGSLSIVSIPPGSTLDVAVALLGVKSREPVAYLYGVEHLPGLVVTGIEVREDDLGYISFVNASKTATPQYDLALTFLHVRI